MNKLVLPIYNGLHWCDGIGKAVERQLHPEIIPFWNWPSHPSETLRRELSEMVCDGLSSDPA